MGTPIQLDCSPMSGQLLWKHWGIAHFAHSFTHSLPCNIIHKHIHCIYKYTTLLYMFVERAVYSVVFYFLRNLFFYTFLYFSIFNLHELYNHLPFYIFILLRKVTPWWKIIIHMGLLCEIPPWFLTVVLWVRRINKNRKRKKWRKIYFTFEFVKIVLFKLFNYGELYVWLDMVLRVYVTIFL